MSSTIIRATREATFSPRGTAVPSPASGRLIGCTFKEYPASRRYDTTIVMVIRNISSPSGETARTDRGRARRGRAQGAQTEKLGQALAALDPDLLEWADGFIFGQVWSEDEVISFEDRMLVAIVALAATGNLIQLRNYLHGGLQAGLNADRLHEALKMLVVYTGFPTALSALGVLNEVRAKYESTD
jgi:4-carboxymuconolactone decarboxylase